MNATPGDGCYLTDPEPQPPLFTLMDGSAPRDLDPPSVPARAEPWKGGNPRPADQPTPPEA